MVFCSHSYWKYFLALFIRPICIQRFLLNYSGWNSFMCVHMTVHELVACSTLEIQHPLRETVRCCLCRMLLIKAWRSGKDWRANMTQRQCEHNCARSILPLKMQVVTVKTLDSEWNFISNRFISQVFTSSGTFCCAFFPQKHIGLYWL